MCILRMQISTCKARRQRVDRCVCVCWSPHLPSALQRCVMLEQKRFLVFSRFRFGARLFLRFFCARCWMVRFFPAFCYLRSEIIIILINIALYLWRYRKQVSKPTKAIWLVYFVTLFGILFVPAKKIWIIWIAHSRIMSSPPCMQHTRDIYMLSRALTLFLSLSLFFSRLPFDTVMRSSIILFLMLYLFWARFSIASLSTCTHNYLYCLDK